MFSFFKKKPTHFDTLHEKWSTRHKTLQEKLWNKHTDVLTQFLTKSKQWAMGSIAGMMLIASPPATLTSSASAIVAPQTFRNVDKNVFFMTDLAHILPTNVRPLTGDEENRITQLLSEHFHMKVTPELEGKRLNRSYGLIGAEQHLARYHGDTMDTHFDSPEESSLYYSSGMAPGLGGYGYFGSDKLGVEREKYYIAVQTFLSPGYMNNVAEYNNFFQFRKMLVVNPNNGKALVADIGDAGPSPWTGKSLGGSPEVMHYLERVDGADKGPVLYFFIDDPDNKVPLGPVIP